MNHVSDEQLILLHYCELDGEVETTAHLEACPLCRRKYEDLHRALQAVDRTPVPERGADYGQEVWRRLQPFLAETKRSGWTERWTTEFGGASLPEWFRRWALIGAVSMLVGAAFLTGRWWPRSEPAVLVQAVGRVGPRTGVKGPILPWKDLSDHLERCQLALIELINTKTNGPVDISIEQGLARELIDFNRLYCQSAARLGDGGPGSILEVMGDLERALVEISNSRAKLSPTEFAELRRRIDTADILFKVRVVTCQVRVRESQGTHGVASNRS
jgi:hypothetical protein